ncbi:hypothetical protein Cantr_04978 [Candida viswanathii]|uniref:PCI domain-containing protein n=1 Tax=Candida viswanathii TaxID=5486 RepID=A0A367XRS0_9ASCO|nr:hypothetical protein Cantr_04978 [Candida viswanathii]
MSSTQILDIIIDQSRSDKAKIDTLRNVLRQLDKPQLLSILSSSITSDPSFRHILELLKIESLMVNFPEDASSIGELVSLLNRSMIGFRHDVKDYKSWFIKITTPDLQSDYQYLFKGLEYDNFIDLINKKMLIINGIPKEEEFREVVHSLNLKILELYLISCYDFRNGNICNYLNDSLQLEEDEEARKLSNLVVLSPFVSKDLLVSIVNHDFRNGYFKIVKEHMDFDRLYLNIIENNIIKLSQYFSFIKIETAYEVLDVTKNLDLESFIFQMVIKNKFNNAVKIDQLEQTVDFGSTFEYTLEDHIKYVGGLVNDVYLRI